MLASSYLQNCDPSPLQISDVSLANGSFEFSGMENTGTKPTWCLGPEAYVSKRYFESYVNKEDFAVMAPVREKDFFHIQRPARCFTLDLHCFLTADTEAEHLLRVALVLHH